MRKIVALRRVLYDALGHFNTDDGWAMASHLAITSLMALFPFLIFATTLASFLGAQAFSDTAVHLVFDTWPEQIAKPIAREVLNVLTVRRTDLLTYGVLLAAYFASNGIEALRTSLNRAYRVVRDARHHLPPRAEHRLRADRDGRLPGDQRAAGVRAAARRGSPKPISNGSSPIWARSRYGAYVIASAVIVGGLFAVHFWLPAGKRRFVVDRAGHHLHAGRHGSSARRSSPPISTISRPM